MEDILIGTTDRTVLLFIPDPASTTGAGKTGLNAAALTCTYTRVETDNDVAHTDVTSSLNNLSALTDAHNDWGLLEVNSTLSKGLYRLDIADAVFASGAWYAVVQLTITSGTAAATPMAFRLVSRDDLDGVRLGLTALPNAAAEAAGGLYTRGTGAGQIAQDANGNVRVNLDTIKTQTVTCDAGVTVLASVGTAAISTAQTGDSYAIVNSGTHGNAALKALIDAIDDYVDTEIATLLSRIGTPSDLGSGASVAANLVDIESQTDDIGVAGAGLTALPAVSIAAGGLGATAFTSAALNAVADAMLDRNMATGTDSGTDSIRTVRQALRAGRNKVDTGAGIVYKEDDATESWSFTVTTAAGNPITVMDPD